MSPSLSVKQLSKRIKDKYPEYKDWNDKNLVDKVTKKYPEYKDWLKIKTTKDLIAEKPEVPPATPVESPEMPSEGEISGEKKQVGIKPLEEEKPPKKGFFEGLYDFKLPNVETASDIISGGLTVPFSKRKEIGKTYRKFIKKIRKIDIPKKAAKGTIGMASMGTVPAVKSYHKVNSLISKKYKNKSMSWDEMTGLVYEMGGNLVKNIGANMERLHGYDAVYVGDTKKKWVDKSTAEARKDTSALIQQAIKSKDKRFLGLINPKDLAELPSSMAFSLTALGLGAGFAVPTTAAAGPQAGAAAAAVGSGVAAYHLATYSFGESLLINLNKRYKKATGTDLTKEQQDMIKNTFKSEAKKYGLWEAIPEAIGNAAGASLWLKGISKLTGGLTSKLVTLGLTTVATYLEEVLTETATEMGQQDVSYKAGLPGGKKADWLNSKRHLENAKNVAPVCFLNTMALGGLAKGMSFVSNQYQSLSKNNKKKLDNLFSSKIKEAENKGQYKTADGLRKLVTEMEKEQKKGIVKKSPIIKTKGKYKVTEVGVESADTRQMPVEGSDISEVAMIQDGKIYHANHRQGEKGVVNHATLVEKEGLSAEKDMVSGFLDKEGDFVFHYADDVPQKGDGVFETKASEKEVQQLKKINKQRLEDRKPMFVSVEEANRHGVEVGRVAPEAEKKVTSKEVNRKGISEYRESQLKKPREGLTVKEDIEIDQAHLRVGLEEQGKNPRVIDRMMKGMIGDGYGPNEIRKKILQLVPNLYYTELESVARLAYRKKGLYDEKAPEAEKPVVEGKEALIEEAKKYDSAEEFIASYPKMYRGDVIGRQIGLINLTESKEAAAGYIRGGTFATEEQFEEYYESGQYKEDLAQVETYYPDVKNTLVVDETGIKVINSLDPKGNKRAKKIIETKNLLYWWRNTKPIYQKAWENVLIPQLREKGYDSISFQDDISTGKTLAVLSPSQLHTESQLKNYHTQAQQKAPEAEKSPKEQIEEMYKELISATNKKSKIRRLKKEAKVADVKEDTGANRRKLRRTIHAWRKRKGISKARLDEIVKDVTGTKLLKPKRKDLKKKVNTSALKEILIRIKGTRPERIGNTRVVTEETENRINTLKQSLIDKDEFSEELFEGLMEDMGLETTTYINKKHFLKQTDAKDLLNNMLALREVYKETIAFNKAVDKNPAIKDYVENYEKKFNKIRKKKETKGKGIKLNPVIDVHHAGDSLQKQSGVPFGDLIENIISKAKVTLYKYYNIMGELEDTVGKKTMKRIMEDDEALGRINRYVASQLPEYVEGKPERPIGITDDEVKIADNLTKNAKEFENTVRYLRFLELYDNIREVGTASETTLHRFIPDAPRSELKKAEEILETEGHNALKEWLSTRSWGVLKSGYDFGEVLNPSIKSYKWKPGVSKSHLKTRQGIKYQDYERNIIQRYRSYIKQMLLKQDVLPQIKALQSLFSANADKFEDPRSASNYLTRFAREVLGQKESPGFLEKMLKAIYGQAMKALFNEPRKPIRNLHQNIVLYDNKTDFLNMKKLTDDDMKFFSIFVSQFKGIKEDWLYAGSGINIPILKTLNKWADAANLMGRSDEANRLPAFAAKLGTVEKLLNKYYKGEITRNEALKKIVAKSGMHQLEDMEIQRALKILARDGGEAFARNVALSHIKRSHFLYTRFERGLMSQGTEVSRILSNLLTFSKGFTQRHVFDFRKLLKKSERFEKEAHKKRTVAKSLVSSILIGSFIAGGIYKLVTGRKKNPYHAVKIVGGLGIGGIPAAVMDMMSEYQWHMQRAILKDDDWSKNKLITMTTEAGDMMIPWYKMGFDIHEAMANKKDVDKLWLKKMRGVFDKTYRPNIKYHTTFRDTVEKMQKAMFGTEKQKKKKKK